MADAPARGIGDNMPPPETPEDLEERLERDHAELIDRVADLEVEAAMLPRECTSDADVDKLNAFAVKAKDLVDALEENRTKAKRPYDALAAKVQDFFLGMSGRPRSGNTDPTGIHGRRAGALARIKPYLDAKEAKRRAEAAAAAEAERQRAKEAQDAADAAAAEEQRLRDEAEAARKGQDPAAIGEAARLASQADDAAQEGQQALQQVAKANRTAEAHEERGASPRAGLATTRTASGTAGLTTVWTYKITDLTKLRASMGPLGSYVFQTAIESACQNAANVLKDGPGSTSIPGLTILRDTRVNSRSNS